MIDDRARRLSYFDRELFADPAWDILLELFVAAAEGREMPITSLCVASHVPGTTMLRWIGQLVARGMVRRERDRTDKRRVLVSLTEKALAGMNRYFDAGGGMPGFSGATIARSS
jgi:DNA-binding MarR family transcriptional regulator